MPFTQSTQLPLSPGPVLLIITEGTEVTVLGTLQKDVADELTILLPSLAEPQEESVFPSAYAPSQSPGQHT